MHWQRSGQDKCKAVHFNLLLLQFGVEKPFLEFVPHVASKNHLGNAAVDSSFFNDLHTHFIQQ